jgi:hypothetical protein
LTLRLIDIVDPRQSQSVGHFLSWRSTKISDETERKHGEKALDEAIENTFPASDPVPAEQPVHAHRFQNPSTAVAEQGQHG